jgi:recombinational DNA repair ATPase RecF
VEDSKYEVGRKLTGERELNARATHEIGKLRETVARLLREQKDDRDQIHMQAEALVQLTQDLADARVMYLNRVRREYERYEAERPYPE